jgi:hypothetical protein
MKTLGKLLAIMILVLGLGMPLTGCENGDDLEDETEEAADEAEEAMEEMGDEAEDAADDMEDTIDDMDD